MARLHNGETRRRPTVSEILVLRDQLRRLDRVEESLKNIRRINDQAERLLRQAEREARKALWALAGAVLSSILAALALAFAILGASG